MRAVAQVKVLKELQAKNEELCERTKALEQGISTQVQQVKEEVV
jgi:hypothetical protein